MPTHPNILVWEIPERNLMGCRPKGCELLDRTEWINTLNLFLVLSEPTLVQIFCRWFQKMLKNGNYFHFLSFPHLQKKSCWESKCYDRGIKVDCSSRHGLSRHLQSSGLCSEALDFSPGSENDLPRKLTASSSLKCWRYMSLIRKFQRVVIGSHPASILLITRMKELFTPRKPHVH